MINLDKKTANKTLAVVIATLIGLCLGWTVTIVFFVATSIWNITPIFAFPIGFWAGAIIYMILKKDVITT